MATEFARTLTADELIERKICPIKKEFVRTGPVARTQVEAVGSAATKDHTALKQKSRKGAKREREEGKAGKEGICFHFTKGICTFGERCKYSHDVAAFLRGKPADLPGPCPFSCLPECPHGVRCRWATKHDPLDAAVAEVLRTSQEAATVAAPSCALPGGVEVCTLPTAESMTPPINDLSATVRFDLRKQRYNFHRADSHIRSMGISCNQRITYKVPEKATKAPVAAGSTPEAPPGAAAAEQTSPPLAVLQHPTATAPAPVEPSAALEDARAAPSEPTPSGAGAADGTSSTPVATVAAARQEAPAGVVPIYDISKSSNGEGAGPGRDTRRVIDFRGKLYCAPLTTNGNLPFRRVVKAFGCDVTCGEMAMAKNLLMGQTSEWALLKRHPSEDFFGVQICGGHPDMLARCVQLLDDNIDATFIDINCGCPIDLVCGQGSGAALLQRPAKLGNLVRAAAGVAQTCAVTFKTRTGFFKPQTVHSLFPGAAGWGAAAMTLHGRTREQRYSRVADWSYIERIADAIPEGGPQLIGNGDVFSFEEYERHMASGKLATCMIARGALIKPWLFTEIKERRHWDISANERFDMLKDFTKHAIEHWGSDGKGIENARRFLLEWLSFLHRYVPVGLLERVPQQMTWRPPAFEGRSDLETLLGSNSAADWVKISEMLLGPVPDGFTFTPKHKSSAYARTEGEMAAAAASGADADDGDEGEIEG